MKKTSIFVILVTIALSWSCKKEVGKVSTTISGQIRTNGTEEPIKVSKEVSKPVLSIYHVVDQVGYTTSGFEKVGSAEVDYDGKFSITLDLDKFGDYFWGVSNMDDNIYYNNEPPSTWWGIYYNDKDNEVLAGKSNSIIVYIGAKSWIRPRFINSNSDANNQDVFKYLDGIGGGGANSQ